MAMLRYTVFLCSALALGCASETGGAATADGKSDEPKVDPAPQPAATVEVAPRPAAGPAHLAPFRAYLNRGHLGKALREEGAVLDQHPDDPWVMADLGFVLATRRGQEERGRELLAKALEVAREPELRAQILYYYARLEQKENGTRGAREVVAKAFAESPYAVVQRNLELIDAGLPRGVEPVEDEIGKAFCEAELANTERAGTSDRSCVVTRVGETAWARVTWIRQDGAGDMAVFHEWRLVAPQPENPEGLRNNFDPNDPISDIAVCRGEEMLTVAQAYGGEGAVLGTKLMDHKGESYLVVECRMDHYNSTRDGELWTQDSSLYTVVCSLESGWCSNEVYSYEVMGDDTVRSSTVVVEPGKIIVTEPGEQPIPYVFP